MTLDESEQKSLLEEVRALRIRLNAIERRLQSSLDEKVLSVTASTASTPPPKEDTPTADSSQPTTVIHAPPPHKIPSQSSQATATIKLGTSRFLGFIAVVSFLLAASFLIKLAIDSGWLTPPRQLALATMLGMGLILIGWVLKGRDEQYLSLLPGTGIVILHMTAYAGRLYHALYGAWTATFLASAVSVLALFLFWRFRREFYLVVAVIGTYLSPVLLPTLRKMDLDLMIFFLLWDLAFAVSSVLLASRVLILVGAYLALGVFTWTSSAMQFLASPQQLLQIAAFQLCQFLVFASGVSLYSIRRRAPLTAAEAWSYFPLLLFFYGIEYSIITRVSEALAPWIALAFAVFVYTAYLTVKETLRYVSLDSGSMIRSFLAIVFFHAFYLELLPDRFTPWFTLLLLGSYPLFSRHLDLKKRDQLVALVIIVVFGLNYFKVMFQMGAPVSHWEWIVLNSLFFVVMVAGYTWSGNEAKSTLRAEWLTGLILANAQALVGLHRLADQISIVMRTEMLGRFLVSLLWGFFALVVLIWGRRHRDLLMAHSSIFIFTIAAGKVLLIDVVAASPVVRILCLLTLGFLLYLGGFLYQHIESWKRT